MHDAREDSRVVILDPRPRRDFFEVYAGGRNLEYFGYRYHFYVPLTIFSLANRFPQTAPRAANFHAYIGEAWARGRARLIAGGVFSGRRENLDIGYAK